MPMMIDIDCGGKKKEVLGGSLAFEITKQFGFDGSALAIRIGNEVVELDEKIETSCTLEVIDRNTSIGNFIYERGLLFLTINSIKTVLGKSVLVFVEHSIDKGIYIKIEGQKKITESSLANIEKEMRRLVESDLLFERVNILRKDAIKYFSETYRKDKADALKYISNSTVTLYKFNNMLDYFFGEMPYSSKVLKDFELTLIDDKSLVLRFPTIYSKDEIDPYVNHEKMFKTYKNYSTWADVIKIDKVFDLNEEVSSGKISDLICLAETTQNNELFNIASSIEAKKGKIKLVLIAGPSSSGKTTTSKKLSIYLRGLGLKPHPLSVDDYFKERDETPLDENGKPDYESINSIDIELFNKNLTSLLAGEEVLLPEYNFITGKKEFKNRLILQEEDILVVEGLHGLNEKLTSSIKKENKFKIYIAPLTVISLDDHNRIKTTDIRLLRRMIRDNKYRGYNASKTISTWADVRKGEEKYVFPFQDEADVIFNSALIYELGALKTYAEPLLFSVEETDVFYAEAIRLINLLRNVLPISGEDIPYDSILREFIGNSQFR